MIPAGELIWVSAQPPVRLFLCVVVGFVITKAGFLPSVAASRGKKIILVCCLVLLAKIRKRSTNKNITLPSLLFSRIVPTFDSSNASALGPLIFVALLYEAIGIAMSWIIKQIFWIPHRFRYGILVAGGWGNVLDIPLPIIMHLTVAAPFSGTSDQNLAVAYIAVFTLVFMITSLGGVNWVAKDFQGPSVLDEDVREHLKTKHNYLGAAIERTLISFHVLYFPRSPQAENSGYDGERLVAPTHQLSDSPSLQDDATLETKHVQRTTEVAERLARAGPSFLQTLAMPCPLSIIGSLIISIIPVLKALLVPDVPGVNIPSAPDGQPPLAIVLNTATFIGGASVPLGLMILGSTIARMEIPGRPLRSLPLGAVVALTIGRLVIMPIFGVLITQGLTRVGILDANDNVLRFVCIFLSCLPTATTQVPFTQVFSGTGNAQHLSMFLIPQYILMFITMPVWTAYTLHLLFG